MQNVTSYTMQDVTMQDSPFWTFTARGLKDALFERVKVHTTRCGFDQAVSALQRARGSTGHGGVEHGS